MKKNAYSIFDAKAVSFAEPFFSTNHNTALRSFAQLAQDKDTFVGLYPADYFLYHVGTFDTESAMLYPNNPEQLACAIQYVVTAPEPDLFTTGEIQNAS